VVSFTGDGYDVVTPCGVPGRVSWGVPIAEAQIVLDPGHGGDVETGAVGANGLAEKDLNLTLAKRAALELETRGISVVLTRTADYRMPLAVRAQIGNDLDAAAIVSLHHNGPEAAPSDGPGTEIFVQQASDESRRLGGTIYGAVTAALGRFDIAWQAAPDAGVLAVINNDDEDSYGMIRRPEIPAVLVEFGYLANPVEAELFATEAYIAVTADALADGIESWLTSDAEGRGFVDEARRFTPSGLTGGSNGCIDPALE
jgi:N-acetylmuramoyl-L-alanine amidase